MVAGSNPAGGSKTIKHIYPTLLRLLTPRKHLPHAWLVYVSQWFLKIIGTLPVALAILSYTLEKSKLLFELAVILAFTAMITYIVYEITRKIKALMRI